MLAWLKSFLRRREKVVKVKNSYSNPQAGLPLSNWHSYVGKVGKFLAKSRKK